MMQLQRIRANTVVLCLFVGLVTLLAVVELSGQTDREFGFFLRDPLQIGKLPAYAGFVSQIGVFAWGGAAAIALFSGTLLALIGNERGAATYLASIGVLTACLAIDDAFMVHENISHLFSETYLFALYGLGLVAIISTHLKTIGRTPWWIFLVSLGFLAASVGVDSVQSVLNEHIGRYRILVEDGTKFLGILFWLAYLWNSSLTLVGGAVGLRAGQVNAHANVARRPGLVRDRSL